MAIDPDCEAVEGDASNGCRHFGWSDRTVAVQVTPVGGGSFHRVAVGDHAPPVEDHQFIADRCGQVGVVGDEQHRHALLAEGSEPVEALLLEGLVAHGQDLVDQQDLRVDVDG